MELEWFGKSKVTQRRVVTRPDGKLEFVFEPKLVYHATPFDFDQFAHVPHHRADEPISASGGIWFGSSVDQVRCYGDRIIKAYLRIEKPYYLRLEDFMEWDDRLGGIRIKLTKADIEEIKQHHDGVILEPCTAEQDALLGLDGEWSEEQYVVWDPKQIWVIGE